MYSEINSAIYKIDDKLKVMLETLEKKIDNINALKKKYKTIVIHPAYSGEITNRYSGHKDNSEQYEMLIKLIQEKTNDFNITRDSNIKLELITYKEFDNQFSLEQNHVVNYEFTVQSKTKLIEITQKKKKRRFLNKR